MAVACKSHWFIRRPGSPMVPFARSMLCRSPFTTGRERKGTFVTIAWPPRMDEVVMPAVPVGSYHTPLFAYSTWGLGF